MENARGRPALCRRGAGYPLEGVPPVGVGLWGGGVVTLGGVLTVCGRVGGLWSPCVAGGWWGWCWGWCGLGVEAVAAVAVAPAVEEAGVVPGEGVAAEADGGDFVNFGGLVVVGWEGAVERLTGPGAVFVGAGVAVRGGEVPGSELAAAVPVAVAGVAHRVPFRGEGGLADMDELEDRRPGVEPMPSWVGCAMLPLVLAAVAAAVFVGWLVLVLLSPASP